MTEMEISSFVDVLFIVESGVLFIFDILFFIVSVFFLFFILSVFYASTRMPGISILADFRKNGYFGKK